MFNNDLPSYVPTSRKQALEAGAAYLRQAVRELRAQAMAADGNPYQAQFKTEPRTGGHEQLMLDVLHKTQCLVILEQMALQEDG